MSSTDVLDTRKLTEMISLIKQLLTIESRSDDQTTKHSNFNTTDVFNANSKLDNGNLTHTNKNVSFTLM